MSPRGRPIVGPRLEVRVTAAQLAIVKEIADDHGQSVAWVVRQMIDQFAPIEEAT